MKIPIRLGRDLNTGESVNFDRSRLAGHMHLLGATGSGKTTFLINFLILLLMSSRPETCLFLVDVMGGLSQSMLNWLAHPTLCPEFIRKRLVYIEPARRDFIMPFNPLWFTNEDDLYHNAGRTVEVVQRAWTSQDTASMPRFRQWLFNALLSVAQMGLPPAAAEFLLRPGTRQHDEMFRMIPERLRMVWAELLGASTNVKMQFLESTRNRLAPFFDSKILQLMLSQNVGRFDVERFIRERRIVIINLSRGGVIEHGIANALAGMFLNELMDQSRKLDPKMVNPTVICLDEFQNYCSEDMYFGLAELRQRGCQLILSHQSLSQLKRGDIDLSEIIWQCRNRVMLCNDHIDADEIAHELASLNYDPMMLMEKLETFRQRKVGQRKELLRNFGRTHTSSTAEDENWSDSEGESRSRTKPADGDGGSSTGGNNTSSSRGGSRKSAASSGSSEGWSETLVDELEDFYETSSKTYYSFEQQMRIWARAVRRLKTGEAICKFRDDHHLYQIKGQMIDIPETPLLAELKAKLIEDNFKQDIFLPRAEAESQWRGLVDNLGSGKLPSIIDGTARFIELERPEDDDDDAAGAVFR